MTQEQIETINTLRLHCPIISQVMKIYQHRPEMSQEDALFLMTIELEKENRRLRDMITKHHERCPMPILLDLSATLDNYIQQIMGGGKVEKR